MSDNPLVRLSKLGQSIWLDYISRGLLESGRLARMIEDDALRGVTSNPTIFEKAISGSADYDDAVRELVRAGRGAPEMLRALTVEDVRRGCDILGVVYEDTRARDGYVSLEVSPHLAHDTEATIAEAHELWNAIGRPNALIKVPATREGIPAIRRLISDGINVNVTLLFGLPRYRDVAEAFIAGLEDRLDAGGRIDRIASVASFFLSRIDTLVDPLVEKSDATRDLRGKTAIACAKVAWTIYEEVFGGERFRRLADAGASTQRLLWASTSTKNPAYPDTMYVDALIAPDTVNTVPPETLDAYRDHGDPVVRIAADVDFALRTLDRLAEIGIDLDDVARTLEDEGVEKFVKPYDSLLRALDEKRTEAMRAAA